MKGLEEGKERVEIIDEVCSHKLVRPSPKMRGSNHTSLKDASLRYYR